MLNRPLLQLTRPVHKGSLSLYPCLIRRLLKKQCFAKLKEKKKTPYYFIVLHRILCFDGDCFVVHV